MVGTALAEPRVTDSSPETRIPGSGTPSAVGWYPSQSDWLGHAERLCISSGALSIGVALTRIPRGARMVREACQATRTILTGSVPPAI